MSYDTEEMQDSSVAIDGINWLFNNLSNTRYDTMSKEEEQETIRLAKDGDKVALNKMYEKNVKLVVSLAMKKRYRSYNVSTLDLIQEGFFGLEAAIEGFDPELGYKFSTYATGWIRQRMDMTINSDGHVIRFPRNIGAYVHRLGMELSKTNIDNKVTIEDLAKKLNVSVEDIKEYLELYETFMCSYSLNNTLYEDELETIQDTLVDENTIDYEDIVLDAERKAAICIAMSTLNEKERDLISRKFGLNGHEEHTYESIGAIYGRSRELIRIVIVRAFKKMKRSFNNMNIKKEHMLA